MRRYSKVLNSESAKRTTRTVALLGHMRITRSTWYRAGGFAEPRCVRVTRGGRWVYYWRCV